MEEKLWPIYSILISRDITLPTKVHLVKAMVFPVLMYGCENWTVKKTEHWRIDAFGLWCWRRLLRVPGTARRSNQSILKEMIPEYSLEGLMLKLNLQYFDLMQRTDSLEETLMLGKIEAGGEGDNRGWDGWMASPTRWVWVWTSSLTSTYNFYLRWIKGKTKGQLQIGPFQEHCQLLNIKGICHPPLWRLNPVLL